MDEKEIEKILDSRTRIIGDYALEKELNSLEEDALTEMAGFSLDAGCLDMDSFKAYLEDVKENGFDHVQNPLSDRPDYYNSIFDGFSTCIEDYFFKKDISPEVLDGYDDFDFLCVGPINRTIICDFIYTETAKGFLEWLDEKEKKNG